MDMANRIQEAIKDILAEGAPVVKESARDKADEEKRERAKMRAKLLRQQELDKAKTDYDIEDIGIADPDAFVAHGVSLNGYDAAFVGVEATAALALEDALNLATEAGWDVEFIDIEEEASILGDEDGGDYDGPECCYVVVLRLRHKD
jgi:hypothetical protein